MPDEPTFQNLQAIRQQEMFVGRQLELESVERNLALPPDHPQRYFVLGVSGQAGMGKTTLLRRFRSVANANGLRTAWCDGRDLDLTDIMASVATSSGAEASFAEFQKLHQKYKRLRNALEQTDGASKVVGAIAAAAGRAGVRIARRVPLAGFALDYVNEDEVATYLDDAAAFVVRQFNDRDDADLLLKPVDLLTPAFVEGLIDIMSKQTIVLFFDTFEATEHFAEPWLVALLEGNYGFFPRDILVVVGGRHRLDTNVWSSLDSLLHFCDLGPLEEHNIRSYLSRKHIKDQERVSEIVRLSRGVPIHLVSLTVGNPTNPQATDTVVDRVLRSVPLDVKDAAVLGAVPRSINRDVIDTLGISGEVLDQLLSLPFVEPSFEGWTYHPVIRGEFLDHGWRESPESFSVTHSKFAEYHRQLMNRETDRGNEGESTKHARELLYHEASFEYAGTVASAVSRAVKILNINATQARAFVSALRDAEVDRHMPQDQCWGMRFVEAIDAFEQGNTQPGISVLSRAIGSTLLIDDTTRIAALQARSQFFLEQGQARKAIADFSSAISVDPQRWELHYGRALANIEARDFDEALTDCEKALDRIDEKDQRRPLVSALYVRIARELLSTAEALELIDGVIESDPHSRSLIIRGELRREIGDSAGAIEDFKRVVESDPGHQHEIAKELGVTYRKNDELDSAEASFIEALRAEPKCDHCWSQLAQVLLVRNDPQIVVQRLKDLEADVHGVAMFRGRALLSIGQVEAAVRELEQALEEEPLSPDAQIRLAQARLSGGDLDGALRQAEEALRLQPDWPAALALRGDIWYLKDQYRKAEEDWSTFDSLTGGRRRATNPEDRGLCLSKLGKFAEAIMFLKEAAEKTPSPVVLYNLSVAEVRERGVHNTKATVEKAHLALLEADVPKVVKSYGMAGLSALIEDGDGWVDHLATALEEDPASVRTWVQSDPAWSDLRLQRRFLELLSSSSGASGS